jgi:hypothetical protein
VHLTRRHPTRTLVFDVPRAGTVRIVVLQVGCGRIASFPLHAHEGTNTLRVRRRIDGRRLPDGTYKIRGRSDGHTVLRATLVVGRGGKAPCSLASVASRIDAVFGPSTPATGSTATAGTAASSTSGSGATAAGGGSGKLAAGKDTAAVRAKPNSGVLGATASKVLPGNGGTQLGLLIVLAAAIFLLTAGALPREAVPHAGAAAFLVRRRATIAVAGLTALAAFLVSYFIT